MNKETLPLTMLAAIAQEFGAPSVLKPQQVALPQLRPTDVLVRVAAAGLNRAEIFWREGRYGAKPGYGDCDEIIGLELAGTVVDIGSAVTDVCVGDTVMGLVGGGSYAEYARMDHRLCMPVPSNLTMVEAGSIPEVMITAHQMLMHLGQMNPGDRVLIHGAGGGVGTTMIQMAKAAGAAWIGTTSSSGKHEQLKALGVDSTIDYASQDFEQEIASQAPGGKVDVIVCNMGGSYFERNVRSLALYGRLVQLGLQEGPKGAMPIDLLLRNCLSVRGSVMKSQSIEEKQAMTRRFCNRWFDALIGGSLQIHVDKVYSLRYADQAHEHLQNGKPFGKVVLDCR